MFKKSFLSVLLLSIAISASSAADPVQDKLAVLKARGLDFSDAAFFLPFADEKGNFPYAEGTRIREWKNKTRPVSFFFLPQWQKNSRLKGQFCLYMDGQNVAGTSGGGKILLPEVSHTISAWVAFEEPVGAFNIFVEGHVGIKARALGYYYGYLHHSVEGRLQEGQPTQRSDAGLKYAVVPREWTHIAGVYDRDKKTNQLYLNGKLVKEVPADIPPIELKESGIYIGTGKTGDGLFKGWIDELAVFQRAFTADEIAALYAKGVPDAGCEKIAEPPRLKPGQKELADALKLEDVWMYSDFNKKTEPTFTDGAAGAVETRQRFPAGGPVFGPGKFGEALLIRGKEHSATPIDTAFIADTLEYAVNFPEGQFTVSFWFKPDSAKWSAAKGLKRWDWTFFSNRFGDAALSFKGDRLEARAGAAVSDGNENVISSGPTTWPDDQWVHIVLSSSATGKTTLYVDGNPVASKDLPYNRDFAPLLSLGKGWKQNNQENDNRERLDGWLDDFLVLKTALSEAGVKQLFASGKPALESAGGIGFALPRTAFKRGEKIQYPVKLPFPGKVEITATPAGDAGAKPLTVYSGETKDISPSLLLDTGLLHPGDYSMTVSVSNGTATEKGSTGIRILPSQDPAIPFGMYCSTPEQQLDKIPDYLDKWQRTGITFARVGLGEHYSRALFMDTLYRRGIEWIPNVLTSYLTDEEKKGLDPVDYNQIRIASKETPGHISLFSSVAQEKLAGRIKNVVAECSSHPGFKFISLWDEYDSHHDISPSGLRYFKEKTGISSFPSFEMKPKGSVVPDNDPYARWIDTFGVGMWQNKGLAYHDVLMTKFAQEANPAIRTMSQPSDGHGGTSVSMPEVYCYLAETDHRRDIGATELLAEHCTEVFRAGDMNRPRKPVWPLLGWWSIPALPGFNESIRVMTEVSLAKGAKGIIYAADTWIFRDDMADSVRRLAGFRDVYGPFLNSLSFEDLGKIALVWNDYEMMGQKEPAGRTPYAPKHQLSAALRLAGIPFEIVHTDQILKGELKRFDAIVLTNYNYATESLKKGVDEFAASGGTVFAAKDDNAAKASALLAPESAVQYVPGEFVPAKGDDAHGKMENVQSLVPKATEVFLPGLKSARPVYADNNYFACYHVPGPGCDVYFIINTDLYLDQAGSITFAKPLANSYSLVDNKPVGVAGNTLPVSLKKGEWQVIASYPAPLKEMKIQAEAVGVKVKFSVAVAASSAVPVTVRFLDPSGKEAVPYRQHAVTGKDGTLTGTMTMAALNDPKGQWTVVAEIPFAGVSAKTQLDIK